MEKKNHTHLSLADRRQIYFLLGRKTSVCRIAEILGRHHSTIYREIQRNTFWDKDHFNNGYFPVNAQEFYRRRRQSLQLFCRYPELKDFVIEKLKASTRSTPTCSRSTRSSNALESNTK